MGFCSPGVDHIIHLIHPRANCSLMALLFVKWLVGIGTWASCILRTQESGSALRQQASQLDLHHGPFMVQDCIQAMVSSEDMLSLPGFGKLYRGQCGWCPVFLPQEQDSMLDRRSPLPQIAKTTELTLVEDTTPCSRIRRWMLPNSLSKTLGRGDHRHPQHLVPPMFHCTVCNISNAGQSVRGPSD
ncbi:uncharacterized protein BO80DRAFT_196262 [Aspergillus ibericus CBS 121593]|uniref:Uncharacterized protein n=1 Tax=Aspergillus ibericus CBS 121593 TaxID=1448316 RepID=A0A395GP46_9EURO|nr:hypothetical protein BO80DRAFT_196262 [Aspergillus ibericus CBS 121593]RAK97249.1 hypothetical protein BO80DRAFT_196262 [Aspergillus ibericus CBS 121593]